MAIKFEWMATFDTFSVWNEEAISLEAIITAGCR